MKNFIFAGKEDNGMHDKEMALKTEQIFPEYRVREMEQS